MTPRAPNKAAKLRSVSPRRKPIQDRGRSTVSAILDAAQLLIEQEGIDRITTIKIAGQIGISVGTVYGYFPNKEAILFRLAERWLKLNREAVERTHPSNHSYANWLDWLYTLVDEILRVYEKEPGLTRHYDMLRFIPELRQIDEEHDKWLMQSMADAFACFDVDGSGKDLQVDILVMMATVHSLLTRAVMLPAAERAATVRRMKQLLHGLLANRFA